ncbi:hypothetical protein [Pseudomonas fluorescens]|uniref:hypothetical protein n=1 Tax=Pseudomonas fluorescens TaxID=294 RepID=UPI001240C876|nr:hypothetical protein [Pseudomonas fluorescens]VVN47338.1 hypothetical protein PS639_05879 [Pseudomonas fluorescens]
MVFIDGRIIQRASRLLANGVHSDPSRAPIEAEVEQAYPPPRWSSPDTVPELPPLLQPELIADPNQQRWVQDLALTDDERRDQALVRETRECTLSNYRGSAGEQGLGPVRRQPTAGESKRTVADLRRRQLRRDELL